MVKRWENCSGKLWLHQYLYVEPSLAFVETQVLNALSTAKSPKVATAKRLSSSSKAVAALGKLAGSLVTVGTGSTVQRQTDCLMLQTEFLLKKQYCFNAVVFLLF